MTVVELGAPGPVLPGQRAQARLMLRSEATADALLRVEVRPPPGWEAEPVQPIWLPPGGEAVVAVHVRPPFTAPPGSHRVSVTVWDPGLFIREQAALSIEVLPHADAEGAVQPASGQALPGSVIWVQLQAANRGNVPLRLQPMLETPAGWQVEAGPSDVAVAPGEAGQTGAWLHIPEFQPPGRYRLVLTLRAPDWPGTWQAQAEVEVPAVTKVEAQMPPPAAVRPRTQLPLHGRLFNAGNVTVQLQPALSVPDGWAVRGLPARLDLEPGQSARLEAAVDVPPGTPPGSYPLHLSWLDPEGRRLTGWSQAITVLPAPAASASPLNPPSAARPGKPLALLARLVNEGNVPLRLEPEVEAPSGWAVLVPPPSLDLAPQEQQTVLMSVLPPAGARAGPHALRVTWADAPSRVSAAAVFALQVPEEARLQVSLLSSPAYTVAEPYRLRFRVRNAGNRPESVRLEVRENLGIPTRAVPAALQLEPGQGEDVTVQADVPADLARSGYHRVVLTALSDRSPDVRASAETAVEVVPRSAPLQAAYRWLPGTAAWGARATPDTRRLTWAFSTAALPTRGGGWLSLRLGEEDSLVAYRGPRGSAAAGRQIFALSPLTLFGREADGVDVRGVWGGWEGVVQALEAPEGTLAGLRLSYGPDPGRDASVQALAAPEAGWTAVSAGFRAALRAGLHLEGEAGCTLAAGFGCGAGALRGASTYAAGPWSLSARWERREPGYEGQGGGSARLEVLLAGDITPALHASAAWQESSLSTERGLSSFARQTTLQAVSRTRWGTAGARYLRRLEWDSAAASGRETDALRLDLARTAARAHIRHELAWSSRRTSADPPATTLSYQLSAYLPAAWGSVAPYVRLTASAEAGLGPASLAGGLRWQQRLTPSVNLVLGGEWEPGPPARASASVALRYEPADGRRLQLDAEGSGAAGQPWTWSVTAGYTVPMEVPLGRKPDVGSFQGRVLDAGGRPVAGAVVRLGTLSAATDAQGRFDFPALSPGTYFLTLRPPDPGPERLSLPSTPWRLDVVPGQQLHQEFRLVEAARIAGRVTAAPAPLAGPGASGGPLPMAAAPLPPAGLVVEALGPAGWASAAADADGRFTLEHLLPGAYRVRVRAESLPPLYEVDPPEVALQLQPGQQAEVAFTVRPVARHVQVQEGGALELEPSEP